MTQVTAEMVKELRARTGVGMGKCKEALDQAKGDMELAISNLRKAGIASAVKKEGRETKEGLIGSHDGGSAVALVEVNSETDFVAKNDQFQKFVADLAEEAVKTKPASVEAFGAQHYSKDSSLTVDQYRAVIVQKIGENLKIQRLAIVAREPNVSIATYSHMGGKIVTLVEITGGAGEEALAKDIAMHIAAESPTYLVPEEIPAATRQQEEEIARAQVKDKPENVQAKIVEGKLNSFYDGVCLTRQKFVKDPSVTVEQLVQKRGAETNKPLKIKRFLRWQVGESS